MSSVGVAAAVTALILASAPIYPASGESDGTPKASPAQPLSRQSTVERAIGPDQVHDFTLPLEEGDYARIEVTQPALETALDLILLDPGGNVVKRSALTGLSWRDEALSVIAERSGPYRLRLQPRSEIKAPGRYRLEVTELRRARDGDDSRVAADDQLSTGQGLLHAPSPDAHREAIECFRRALDISSQIGDVAAEARALDQIGNSQLALDEPREALASYGAAVQLYERIGDLIATAATLNSMGFALDSLDDKEAAGQHYRQALELARRGGDRKVESSILNNLGDLSFDLGELETARAYSLESLRIRRETGDLRRAAGTLNNLGVIYRRLGQTGEAIDSYEEALDLVRELQDTLTEAVLLNNIGVVSKARGALDKALQSFAGARILARQAGNQRWEALVASNQGSLHHALGELDQALKLHELALELDREIGSASAEARDLREIGSVHEARGRPEIAVGFYESALPKSVEARDPKIQSYVLQGIGRCRLALGDPGAALELFERALDLQRSSANWEGQAATHRDIGRCRRRMADFEGAAESLERSRELAGFVANPGLEAAANSEIARLERERGNLTAALEAIEMTLSTRESLRTDVPSPDLRASFFSQSQEDFAFYVDLLLELDEQAPGYGYAIAAFEASERARSRSLVELLTEARIEVREGISDELIDREQDLVGRLSELQSELVRELSLAAESTPRIEELRRELDRLKTRRREFEIDLRRQHPRYAGIRYPEPADLRAVRGLLDADAALLEYSLGEERSFLFTVTRDDFSVSVLPGAARISELARDGRESLAQPGRKLLGRFRQTAMELYDLLVEPAAELIADKSRLIVSPDGDLHLIPFEALVDRAASSDGEDEAGYLVTRWAVSYVPSASVLANLQAPRAAGLSGGTSKAFVGFADPLISGTARRGGGRPPNELAVRGSLDRDSWRWLPLPGARREVTEISRLFPIEDTLVFFGGDAQEAHVKTNPALSSARYLHFASHAIVDDEQPAYSALLLSEGGVPAEDGLLQVHEIFNLKLDSDLVVLSACETALGRRVRGEGLIGLTRAFLYAGSRAVSVSLWPVADQSTAELMLSFYRQVNAGAGNAEALRKAKMELIGSGSYAHPYYWAPFVLMGKGE